MTHDSRSDAAVGERDESRPGAPSAHDDRSSSASSRAPEPVIAEFLEALKPIERSAAWSREQAERSPSSHQEFIREAEEHWARYERAKATLASRAPEREPVTELIADLVGVLETYKTARYCEIVMRAKRWLAASPAPKDQIGTLGTHVCDGAAPKEQS